MDNISSINVEERKKKTFLIGLRTIYPLRIVQQEHWLPYITVVLLGFGGGLVGNDAVNLSINLKDHAILCVKTQGSTKVFKTNDNRYSTQSISSTLNIQSFLCFIPDPICCFNESKYIQTSSFTISKGASLVAVDWFTSGRMGRDNFWGLRGLSSTIHIVLDGRIILAENLRLDNDGICSMADKVGKASVIGNLVLIGPKTAEVRSRLQILTKRKSFKDEEKSIVRRSFLEKIDGNKFIDEIISVSNFYEDCCIVRFALDSVEAGYELLAEILNPLQNQIPGIRAYQERISYSKETAFSAKDRSRAISLLRMNCANTII